MKSKRGFMLGEYTLKVVIAVLCILLLFFLLFRLYSNSVDERRINMAKATLDSIEEKMLLAKESGEIQSAVLLNPKASPLGYWNEGEEGLKPPLECEENCLCLCTGTFSRTAIFGGRIVTCNEPVCKSFDKKLFIEGDSILGIPTDIEIEYKEEGYVLRKKKDG